MNAATIRTTATLSTRILAPSALTQSIAAEHPQGATTPEAAVFDTLLLERVIDGDARAS